MAESHVVSGLVAKRSELSGLLNQHQEVIHKLLAAIATLNASIKLFAPDYDVQAIKAKAPKRLNPWFEHGEANRLVLDALRTAAVPQSTRQIGEAMIAGKGMSVQGYWEWDAVLNLVLGALQRLEKKGFVTLIERYQKPGGPMIWQIV